MLACALLLIALWLMPRATAATMSTGSLVSDIPARMVLAAILVFGLTSASELLGPRASGLLTPFPVAATLLAAFTHHLEGAAAAARLLRGLLVGLFSFALFFLIVGISVKLWGTVVAFTAATLGAIAMQGVVWRFVARDRVPQSYAPLSAGASLE
jgi:hypothetical protein